MSTLTVYSDPEDAMLDYFDGASSWSANHNQATANYKDATSTEVSVVYNIPTPSKDCQRHWFAFDVSALPGGATVSAGTFSLCADGFEDHNSDAVVLFESTQAALIVALSDYRAFGSTELASRYPIGSWPAVNSFADFSLNSSGVAVIQAAVGGAGIGAYAKFCTRAASDTDSNAPSAQQYAGAFSANQTGTTKDPKLVITYTSSTTYNQTVAAIGAGVAAMVKKMTMSRFTLAATGAGVAAIAKKMTMSITTLAATGAGVGKVLKGITVSIATLHAIGAGVATISASRAYLKTVAAVGAAQASIATAMVWGKVVAATGAGSAALSRVLSLGRTLASTGVGSAAIITTRGIILRAVGVGVAHITSTIGKTLSAIGTVRARIQQDFWNTKYTPQGDDYDVKYPHGE